MNDGVFEMFELKQSALASAVAVCVIMSACSGDGPVAAREIPQLVGAADGQEAGCTTDQLEHNRQLVKAFFAPERTPLDAYNMMTPDYIQHNEGVLRFGKINNLNAHEAFLALDNFLTSNGGRPELSEEPGRPKNEMAYKIIAICDYVTAVHRTYAPDPQNAGAYYAAYDFELWRIKEGKFAEHWDSQSLPTPLPSFLVTPLQPAPAPVAAVPSLSQFVGAADGGEVRCTAEQLEHNRQLVKTFFTPERTPLDAYNMMAPDYIQHNEGVIRFGRINGLNDREAFLALDKFLTSNGGRPELVEEPGRPKNEMAYKIIASCDYVTAVHRTYAPDPQNAGAYYTVFDFELWRIKDGKFAEHWDSQRIPTPMPQFLLVPLQNL
ncbi:hypothetical protein [Burkholderia sp. AU45388]|uniref:nuclear transport factor 2 family protein n=1 Tax=Burkholderia sp. AU45388 TaxID=3059206 RepID=UPI00264F6293|nr:hypothetical protein [Burkholderia sp. AU45388]MDN7431518.1 hypothetical protein [Burkholderia sp. AU45388]